MRRVLPVAVLASGEGTTLEGLAEAISGAQVPARIALVISDRPNAHVIERARRLGLPTGIIPFHGRPPGEAASALDRALEESGSELVVLAGFLSILPRDWVRAWSGRVINVHPSLLPKYGGRGMYGAHVHEAVLAAGERESGVSVHLVFEEVDRGTVLLQARFPVVPGDTPETLRARAHPVELELLGEAVGNFAEGRWPLPYVSGAEPARGRAR
ncbi:MAG: phosphoribosylglycinamide formyltransferase, partial [Candidatus Lutacidiplasmatales archaeon]